MPRIITQCQFVFQRKMPDWIQNVTALMVAHRLSKAKNCDHIIMLEKGKIVEQGTFEKLMAKQGKVIFHSQ